MNGDLVFLVFVTLVPPIWLGVGLVGLALRSKRAPSVPFVNR